MNISFSQRAEADLARIFAYISLDDVEVARRAVARILQAISMLEYFPLLGRVGRVPETRELRIVGLSYYAVYHFLSETDVEVIAVIHDRQQFPPE